jgi:hypothetical protein
MRATIFMDDHLVETTVEYVGQMEYSPLVRMALMALIEREKARRIAREEARRIAREEARRLALLGGSDPEAEAPPRRRFD